MNVTLLGGSVLGSLSFQLNLFASSDIDVFVYGLDTTEATKRVFSGSCST